jgi:hypothetical protein
MDDTDTGLTRPITVFLLDDHEIVRRGLIDLLGTTAASPSSAKPAP